MRFKWGIPALRMRILMGSLPPRMQRKSIKPPMLKPRTELQIAMNTDYYEASKDRIYEANSGAKVREGVP